jgi:8-oxo-dGTP diphosphatase
MKHWEDVPMFGERVAGQRYVVRPSAYAVIQNDLDQFAVVLTPVGLFLPGGGIEIHETPEQTIAREALEECGLLVRPGLRIAHAVQLVYSSQEDTYFEKPSVFLRAVIESANMSPSELDHDLLWVSSRAAADDMTHESHAWVVRTAAQPAVAGGRGPR